MSWKTVKLKELLIIRNGKDHKELADGNIPVYGTGGVMRHVNQFLFDGESILLPRKGTLSNIQYVSGKFWTVDTIYYTEINKEKANSYYLFRYLRSLDLSGLDTGATIPSMTFSKYYGIDILLPPMEIQNRIASILSAYDNLIENNQKQIKILEEAAQRLYKEWFVDLHFPGYEDTKIVDGVPEGWHKGSLKELIIINYGKDHKKVPNEGNIPVYGSGGLMRKCNKSLFSGESVLIPRKGSLNNIMYVNEAFWTVDTMFFATMKHPNTALFVYFYVRSFDMYAMNIGAAVPSMTVNILDAMAVLIPNEALLKEYDEICQRSFVRIKLLTEQRDKLHEARDRLLPKLMNGELEV